MSIGTNDTIFSILLSREEVLLLLKLIKAETIPGLGEEPIGELSQDQLAIGYIYAERALRARELAHINSDGKLAVNQALLETITVCAYSQNAIVAHHFPVDGRPKVYSGHSYDGAHVSHVKLEDVLHLFSILPDQDTILQQTINICQLHNLPKTDAKEIKVTHATLEKIHQALNSDNHQIAIDLVVASDSELDAARAFVKLLAQPHTTSILYYISPSSTGGQLSPREITILQNEESAWLMINPDETKPTEYAIQSLSSTKILEYLKNVLAI